MAQIGVMQALKRHVERVFDASRKDAHWGKRKLKRNHNALFSAGHPVRVRLIVGAELYTKMIAPQSMSGG
jgi:hypothetical protein